MNPRRLSRRAHLLLFTLLLACFAWPAAAQQNQNTQEQGSAAGANLSSAKIGDNEAVATGKDLRIIDKNLVQKGKIKFKKKITAVVALSKNLLIVITGEGLFYIDVTDPTKPGVTGFVPIYGGGISVSLNTQTAKSGQVLANVCSNYNFICYDVTNPYAMYEVGHIYPDSSAGYYYYYYESSRLDQNHCITAAGPHGFVGINTSGAPPSAEGFFKTSNAQSICQAGGVFCGVDNYPPVMHVLTPVYDNNPLTTTLGVHVTGFNQLSTMSLPGSLHIIRPFPSPPLGKPGPGKPLGTVTTPVRVLVAADTGGVHVVNLTNPKAPVLERTIAVSGAAMNVNTDGTTTLVHLQSGKTLVYDTTNQANWVLRKTLVSGRADDAVAQGSRLYVAGSTGLGLQAYDLSNLNDPPLLGYLDNSYYSVLQPLDANTLLAGGSGGLAVLDVSNPAAIQQKGSVSFSFTRGIALHSHYAMLSGGGFPDNLCVVDITTPTQPKKVNSFKIPLSSGTSADQIAISGNYAYVAAGPAGVVAFRLDNPTSWSMVSTMDPPVNSSYGGFTTGVAVYGSLLALGDSGNGLHLYDISNPAKPVLLFSDTSIIANHLAMDVNNVYVSSDILRVYDIKDPRHAYFKASFVTPDNALNCRPVKGRVYVSSGEGGVSIVDLLSRATDWGRYQ